jgi:hypothetical protein
MLSVQHLALDSVWTPAFAGVTVRRVVAERSDWPFNKNLATPPIRTSNFTTMFARIRLFAALAQLVEQFIRNEKVASSIPASGTRTQQQVVAVKKKPVLLTGARVFFMPLRMEASS